MSQESTVSSPNIKLRMSIESQEMLAYGVSLSHFVLCDFNSYAEFKVSILSTKHRGWDGK